MAKAEKTEKDLTPKQLEAIHETAAEMVGKLLSATSRRIARYVGYALPAAATTSRIMAQKVLATNRQSRRCRYHEVLKRSNKVSGVDTATRFIGHAYPELELPKSGKDVVDLLQAKEGHLRCGCSIDDELLSFYLWKTVPLTSTNPDFTGVMQPQTRGDILDPRSRKILVETFKMYAGLTIDELYEIGCAPDAHNPKSFEKLRLRQVCKFVNELRDVMKVDIRVQFGEGGTFV